MRRKKEQVKKLRVKVIEDVKNGLTYEEIRRKRGVSPSTISQWTKGKDLKRYCRQCGETDPKKLEKHHPNKKESPEHTDLPPENWSSYCVRVRIKEGGEKMAKRSYRPEQIINKLREAEVLLCQGSTIGEAARRIGVTEQTYYRWQREYGGMRIEQVKRLKELEKENTRLKRLVADLSLDNDILKEASRGNS